MHTVEAISPGDLTTIGVVATLVLVVVGVLLAMLLTAIVARVLIAAVVVVLAVLVWQQRGHIEDEVNDRACHLDATFFGIHVDPPDEVRRACRNG